MDLSSEMNGVWNSPSSFSPNSSPGLSFFPWGDEDDFDVGEQHAEELDLDHGFIDGMGTSPVDHQLQNHVHAEATVPTVPVAAEVFAEQPQREKKEKRKGLVCGVWVSCEERAVDLPLDESLESISLGGNTLTSAKKWPCKVLRTKALWYVTVNFPAGDAFVPVSVHLLQSVDGGHSWTYALKLQSEIEGDAVILGAEGSGRVPPLPGTSIMRSSVAPRWFCFLASDEANNFRRSCRFLVLSQDKRYEEEVKWPDFLRNFLDDAFSEPGPASDAWRRLAGGYAFDDKSMSLLQRDAEKLFRHSSLKRFGSCAYESHRFGEKVDDPHRRCTDAVARVTNDSPCEGDVVFVEVFALDGRLVVACMPKGERVRDLLYKLLVRPPRTKNEWHSIVLLEDLIVLVDDGDLVLSFPPKRSDRRPDPKPNTATASGGKHGRSDEDVLQELEREARRVRQALTSADLSDKERQKKKDQLSHVHSELDALKRRLSSKIKA